MLKDKKEGIDLIDVMKVTQQLYMDKMVYSINESLFGMPKIVSYRNVKVPKYLTIKVPVIERYTYYEYGDGEPSGWLITFKHINICKIGTKIERQPVYEKPKKTKQTIKYKRFSKLI